MGAVASGTRRVGWAAGPREGIPGRLLSVAGAARTPGWGRAVAADRRTLAQHASGVFSVASETTGDHGREFLVVIDAVTSTPHEARDFVVDMNTPRGYLYQP